MILFTACGTEQKQNDSNISQATNQVNATPETTVLLPSETETPTQPENTPEPTKKKLTKKEKYESYAKKIKLKVYNKKVLPVDYNANRFSDFIELDYKVVNKSSKAIKGIKGTLHIYDQFDEPIMSLQWDVSDGIIGAGKTKKVTNYGIDYNQFLDDHNKVHSLAYEDMIFKYEMEQINFSDGYKLKLD